MEHFGKYFHTELGFNFKMSEMEAALGLVQLKKLERFNQRRIRNARLLTKGLSDINGITPPYVDENVKHVFHQYTIRVKEKEFGLSRDDLGRYLLSKGIETQVYYPISIYMQPVFQDLSGLGRQGCPNMPILRQKNQV